MTGGVHEMAVRRAAPPPDRATDGPDLSIKTLGAARIESPLVALPDAGQTAHQMFHPRAGYGVSGPGALRLLLQDAQFPRSVDFSLSAISPALLRSPRAALPLGRCAQIQTTLRGLASTDITTPGDLHVLAEDLQEGIGELHDTLPRAYFRFSPERAPHPAMLEPS